MFIFRGSGFGHGLGLCQNGAHVMARRGGTFEQILDKYFPGARISGEQSHAKAQSRKDSLGGAFLLASTAALRLCAFALTARQTLSSEHFHIGYPARIPRSEIEAALRLLEAARLDMFARAGPASLSLPDPVDVVVHETAQDFTAATGQPWWAAGVTHGRRIELQPLNVLRRRRILTSTLRHEYAHSVIEANGGSGVPRWLVEGLAISFAGEGRMLLRFRSKPRLPLDELERRLAHPGSATEMRSLYAAAYYEVRTLIRKEGEPSVWRRVAAHASGARTA